MNLFHGHGTGSLKLVYDWRDRMVYRHPSVAAKLASFADTASLRQYQTGPALDQGSESSCAAFSSCHLQAFYESMERGKWIVFDGHFLYVENGGTGNNGVSSRDVLQDMQDRGCPVYGSNQRYKIQSYAFVDFSSDFLFAIQTVKASIAAKRPLVLALKLPSDYSSGRNAGAPSSKVTDFYHQVLVAGYDKDNLDTFGSWGPSLGDNGWVNISIDFLARPEQQGYLYAFTSFDAPDDDAPPPPPPPPVPPAKIEFDATLGRLKGNGGLVIWPTSASDLLTAKNAPQNLKIHVKEN